MTLSLDKKILSDITVYSKYAKHLPELERRETWEELVERNMQMHIKKHPNIKKYPKQEMYVIEIDSYIYLVPFVKEKNYIFLKTIFPSRKATKKYLNER